MTEKNDIGHNKEQVAEGIDGEKDENTMTPMFSERREKSILPTGRSTASQAGSRKRTKTIHDLREHPGETPRGMTRVDEVTVEELNEFQNMIATATAPQLPSYTALSYHTHDDYGVPAPSLPPGQIVDATSGGVININGYLLDREAVYAAVASDVLSRNAGVSSPWDMMGRVITRLMQARDQDMLRNHTMAAPGSMHGSMQAEMYLQKTTPQPLQKVPEYQYRNDGSAFATHQRQYQQNFQAINEWQEFVADEGSKSDPRIGQVKQFGEPRMFSASPFPAASYSESPFIRPTPASSRLGPMKRVRRESMMLPSDAGPQTGLGDSEWGDGDYFDDGTAYGEDESSGGDPNEPGSGEFDFATYETFLQSVVNPGAHPGSQLDEDDDDPDFTLSGVHPLLRGTEYDIPMLPASMISDNIVEGANVSLENLIMSDPPMLVSEPREEYRADRAALISRKEYQELVEGVDDAAASSETYVYNAKELDVLVPLAPRDCNSESAQYLFTSQQMERLRRQQQQNMQLLLQVFLLEREVRGEQSSMIAYTAHQLNVLYEQQRYASAAYGSAFPSFHHIVGLDLAVTITRQRAYRKDAKFERALQRPAKRKRRATRKDEDFEDIIELPATMKVVIEGFREVFDPVLIPRMIGSFPKQRLIFLPAQDELLFLGLQMFGDDNMNTIRTHMLPNMSAKQLLTRYKNMRSRRAAAENPLKDYYLMRVKPFAIQEEELLRKAVKFYGGRKFKQISEQVLKERSSMFLKQVWKRLYPRSFHPPPKRAVLAGTIAGMTMWVSSRKS